MRGHDNPYLEICFRPTVATINEARRLVGVLFGPILSDPDLSARLQLAAHEMLENALKYSLDGSTKVCVEVSRAEAPCRLKVETRNAISDERKAGLTEVFAEMKKFGSADEYYQFAMKRTRHVRHGSGLGLARIWSEAEMDLSHSFEGDEAIVTAMISIEAMK